MKTEDLRLFFEPKDRLRLTIGDERSFHTVRAAWSAPLSHPGKYLALLDGKGNEIVTIDDPVSLPAESLEAARQEISYRYLTAAIERIVDARTAFGVTYWTVETDRGQRDFVTQSLQENAQWLSSTQLLLVDVDANRFEIRDTKVLDERSRSIIETVL
jgi:hypothetical protein